MKQYITNSDILQYKNNQKMKTLEKIELDDWHVDNTTPNETRREKSISSYYLNCWYHQVEDITFKTHIYLINNSLEIDCPAVLPFKKCMVRYENRSPKDSEFWGPVTTKEELLRVFDTSLRCKLSKTKSNFLCIREWQDNFGPEFRCFWNRRLVAVSNQSEMTNDYFNSDENMNEIIKFVYQCFGSQKIPYHRCVFDIVKLLDGTFKLIEFNSWETNSGARPFDWTSSGDTEILYPGSNNCDVHFRSLDNKINKVVQIKNNLSPEDVTKHTNDFYLHDWEIVKPIVPMGYLLTEKYLYVQTDIWLGAFVIDEDNKLKNVAWKRGVYRFSDINETENGLIKAGYPGTVYYPDLTLAPHHLQNSVAKEVNRFNPYTHPKSEELEYCEMFNKVSKRPPVYLPHQHRRYGIYCKSKQNGMLTFFRLFVDGDNYYFDL